MPFAKGKNFQPKAFTLNKAFLRENGEFTIFEFLQVAKFTTMTTKLSFHCKIFARIEKYIPGPPLTL